MTTASAATRASGTTGSPPNAPGSMMADRDRLNVRLDSLAPAGRQHRRPGRDQHQRPRCGRGPDRPGPVVVLPARVLLGQRAARRQMAHNQGAREAPGVEVRARKGYRALRPEDMLVASARRPTPLRRRSRRGRGPRRRAQSIAAALGSVSGIREGQPWRSRAAYFFHAGAGAASRTGRVLGDRRPQCLDAA